MRQPYQITLWYRRQRWLFPGLGIPQEVIEGEQRFLDLSDEAAMTEEVAALAFRHRGSEDRIGQYALQVNDPVTGEYITKFSPTLADLEAVRDGHHVRQPGTLSLTALSDEMLVRELARRLRERG